MLGSSTKHFKTYGRRKINVINKRVVLGDSKSDSNNNNIKLLQPRHKSGGWSDSSDDDEEEQEEEEEKEPVSIKRKPVTRPKKSNVSQNKENSPSSRLDTSATREGSETKKEVIVAEPSEESSDLPVRVPLRKKVVVGTNVRSRIRRVVESTDEEETEASVLAVQEEEPAVLEDSSEAEPKLCEEEEEEVHLSDLSEPESDLVIVEDPEPRTPSLSSFPFSATLSPLLESTLSPTALRPYDFSSFVDCPLAPFSIASTDRVPWRKVGEASYSEVFSTTSIDGTEIVIKIIPIASLPDSPSTESTQQEEEEEEEEELEMPFASDWEAVKREIEISQCVGGNEESSVQGFVRFRGAFLVQGAYPTSLLAAWDQFKSNQKPACDDQIRPSVLPRSQLYALVILDHAGTDLESWKLRDWREAKEIWDQIVEKLGTAEQQFEFEHRDLHWGNVLVAPAPPPPQIRSLADQFASLDLTPSKNKRTTCTSSASTRRPPTVKATLIDFTLSRMLEPTNPKPEQDRTTSRSRSKSKNSKKKLSERNRVLFDPFEDECIFEGEGDEQFEVYRGMRTVIEREGGGWQAFHPRTNLLWLHYLVTKLLHSKKLKTPSLPTSTTSSSGSSSSSPFCSPGRAVPSPRKTRRHSLVFVPPPPSPFSSSTFERKSRTLPSTTLLSKQQRTVTERQKKDLIEEVKAWESLNKAQAILRETLRDLIDGGRDETIATQLKARKVSAASKKRGKGSDKVEEEKERIDFDGAEDFAGWWRGH